jgi:hypothetical protein
VCTIITTTSVLTRMKHEPNRSIRCKETEGRECTCVSSPYCVQRSKRYALCMLVAVQCDATLCDEPCPLTHSSPHHRVPQVSIERAWCIFNAFDAPYSAYHSTCLNAGTLEGCYRHPPARAHTSACAVVKIQDPFYLHLLSCLCTCYSPPPSYPSSTSAHVPRQR